MTSLSFLGISIRPFGVKSEFTKAALLDVRVISQDGNLIRHFILNPSKNHQPRRDD
jgi:hypothetical protein